MTSRLPRSDRFDTVAAAIPDASRGASGAVASTRDATELFREISGYLGERWQEAANRPSGARRHHRVLLAYTDSAPARRALETVVSLFDLIHPDVRVLHLREWIPGRGGPFYVDTVEDARSTLADALQRLERAGVPATGLLRSAAQPHLGAEIAAAAARMRASAIVLGASRHRWLARLLRGSVSSAVTYAATCPVILAGANGKEVGRPITPARPDGFESQEVDDVRL